MFSAADEIRCQREVFEIISHGDDKLVQDLFGYHNMILAITFRKIITEYENKYNRVPTADELIWITSEKLKEDIRKII